MIQNNGSRGEEYTDNQNWIRWMFVFKIFDRHNDFNIKKSFLLWIL